MMGQEVEPIVSTLWRILHFLDDEERHWSATCTQACRERSHQDRWEDSHHSPRHDNDVTPTKAVSREGRRRGRSLERRSRGLNSQDDMATPSRPPAHSPGRGRTPSPKRNPAPAPPNPMRCPSPAPKAVSTGDVLPSDQQGWLTDQLRGRKVWCAVADMLFCVFEAPDSKVSKQVLLLPGCKVRQVEFKTASRDNRLVNGVGRKFKSKTISGMDKFQFWLENGTKRQRLMFSVDSKEDLDRWMDVLTRVASVDPDSIAADGEAGRESDGGAGREGAGAASGGEGDSDTEGGITPRSRSTESLADAGRGRGRGDSVGDVGAANGGAKMSAYTPTQNLPRRIDFLSMSLGNARDVGKDSVDDIRKRLRRDPEQSQDAKTTPLKATYAESDVNTPAAPTTRRRSFFRVGGFESLFGRTKKRSASADDALRRKSMKDGPSDAENGSPSPQLSRKEKRKLARTGSEELVKEGNAGKGREGRAFLSRSWDPESNSRGLGASIRRSASDLKSRLFSASGKSRGPGLRLADLTDFRLQGYLQYKGTSRWVRVWAVLCRGCFYGFKSERPDETPLLVFLLPQCTVSFLSDSGRRPRKPLSFKLSQPHCRSLYLSAGNRQDLAAWLQALQLEACRVLPEDDVSSLGMDNGSNASVDDGLASSGGVRRTASSTSLTATTTQERAAGGARAVGSSTRGSESSACSFDSSDESGLASDSSALTSSGRLELTSEDYDVTGSSPRPSTGSRSVQPSPRSAGHWSLAEELWRRHGLVTLDDVSGEAGGDNVSSCGSTGSQPSTPRHDDALTQVWGKDKGYLLQLIRTKLLRRKKKGGGAGGGGSIYNKELARSHEGGLLIQHDDEDELSSVESREKVLLGEVRHRSRSFTETTTITTRVSRPPSDTHPPTPHPGWASSPTTPRDAHSDAVSDVRGPPRHSRQRDVTENSDGGASGVTSVPRHPRQRCVSDDDPARDVTPGDAVRNSDVGPGPCGEVDVDADVSRWRDAERGRTSSAYSARAGDVKGNGDARCDEDGDRGPGWVRAGAQQAQPSLVHSRTYSAAWDEYDSGEEPESLNSISNDNVNDHHDDRPGRVGSKPWGREGTAHGDDTWVTAASNIPTPVTSYQPGVRASSGRAHTIPRDRASALHPPSHNQASVPSPGLCEDSASSPRDGEPAARHSYSETLGRKPRGPILRYFQRTREAESKHSAASAPSPRGASLESPREQKPDVTSLASPRTSSSEPQRSSRGESSAGSAQEPNKPTTTSTAAPERPSNLPTAVGSAANRRSNPGVPQSPRNSPSSGLPSPRSSSQGPPQSARKSSSGIPVSSKGASSGGPRKSSAGHPASERSSSVGPAHRSTPSEDPPESSRLARGSGGRGEEGQEKGRRARRAGRVQRPMAVMELAAGDLQSPTMHGYLHRKTFNDQWVRYWYVLQDECLYCYLTPDDRVTVDVTDLDGYTVTLLEDKFPGHRFVLHLEYEDYVPVYLSASSREELEEWAAALTSAIKAMPRVNGLDPQDAGEGARGGRVKEERVLGIKQKLLAEVLRQKEELERKQAARLASKHKQLSLDESDLSPPLPTPHTPGTTPTGEQICTLTRLRQRRMSTQIKMDTLQRQIQSNGHSKKSRFTFGKRKSGGEDPPAPHNPDVMEQLKTLSDHLSAIDRDLLQNGGVMTLDRKWSRGRKLTSTSRHSQDGEIPGVGVGVGGWESGGGKSPRSSGVEAVLGEESVGIARSNSLKSSMQKLAHKTFARAGWNRGKKSSQGESLEKDEEDRTSAGALTGGGEGDHYPHPHHPAPDVIDLTHRLLRTWPARESSQDSEEGGVDAFLPPPLSFNGGADTPSPVSSPRSPRSPGSVSSGRGQRPSSTGSSHRFPDDPKTARRQVDPDAVANIEAFEEMSRQILGEAPT